MCSFYSEIPKQNFWTELGAGANWGIVARLCNTTSALHQCSSLGDGSGADWGAGA